MTNDHNKGALGAFRVAKRKAPNLSLDIYNARKMYKHNQTRVFVRQKCTGLKQSTFLRRAARKQGSQGRAKARREQEQKAAEARVAENTKKINARKQKKTARAASAPLDFNVLVLQEEGRTVKNIDLQLDWH